LVITLKSGVSTLFPTARQTAPIAECPGWSAVMGTAPGSDKPDLVQLAIVCWAEIAQVTAVKTAVGEHSERGFLGAMDSPDPTVFPPNVSVTVQPAPVNTPIHVDLPREIAVAVASQPSQKITLERDASGKLVGAKTVAD
jgi:hypothetical protein